MIEDRHLTWCDVFSLFARPAEDTRLVACADSEEYLAVVMYLTRRGDRPALN